MELPSSYDPKEAESRWYKIWEDEGHFHADENDGKEPYCIVVPPPNVTGSLHMGHALNNTLQDILIRWQRMQGKSVLWMPGMDHAGIATQNVVERLIAKEGKNRHDLGREEFVKRVWEWKAESGGQIKEQQKRLGCSMDWQRERFTLDEGLSKAVRHVFVSLYKEGLIYQGERIINWCPRCGTALSDIETEYEDLPGKFYHIKYPIKGHNEYLVVATTRPETMLGDTAVAFNPEDERYLHMNGAMLILPLVNREIPLISDDYVDREFGTGLVKITPAHDPNDFEVGRRHNLPIINVMTDTGIINEHGGKYEGLDRFEARKQIVADLEAAGLLLKVEDHQHAVGHCYRCRTIVEPYLSRQWFVQIKPLATKAIHAVEEGKINFVPENWTKTYYEWMYNIRDWCISRQLWWGHRIPAFYCEDCGHVTVELEDPTECEKCHSKNIVQDEDVLDTWFSSGLWPFSTLGWPDSNPALSKYYPTNVLVTGFDIIFFWVARMIMMGLKFMDDIPFKDVYIHALVRDEHGQKMSKSKGNVIDPLIMMDKYGTDAFRFTMAIFAAQGRDVMMSEKRIEGYSAFCNKIWNATRYILMNLGDSFKPAEIDTASLENFDRWILTKTNDTVRSVTKKLEEYKFNEAAQMIYDFWWNDFCAWYLEITKPRLYGQSTPASAETAKQVLYKVLVTSLKLMHPFMPYITEEIWSKIAEGRLVIASWPQFDTTLNFPDEAAEVSILQEVIYKIRNIRGENNIAPNIKANVVFKTGSNKITAILDREKINIQNLARIDSITISDTYSPASTDVQAVIPELEIFIPLADLIDFDKEKARLKKEIEEADKELVRVNGKLENPNFTSKAPADVIAKEEQKRSELNELKSKLTENLNKIM